MQPDGEGGGRTERTDEKELCVRPRKQSIKGGTPETVEGQQHNGLANCSASCPSCVGEKTPTGERAASVEAAPTLELCQEHPHFRIHSSASEPQDLACESESLWLPQSCKPRIQRELPPLLSP